MPTLVVACGFECRSAGNTASHLWNNNVAPAIETTVIHPDSGTASLSRTYASAVNDCGVGPLSRTAAARYHVARFAIRRNSSFTGTAEVATWSVSGGNAVALAFDSGAGKLALYDTGRGLASRQVASPTFDVDTWYWIDIRIDGTNKTADWNIDGSAQTQFSGWTTGGSYNAYILLGANSTGPGAIPAAGVVYYDHVGISQTTGDYPLTHSGIKGFSPSADGTHSTGRPTPDGTVNFTNAAGTEIDDNKAVAAWSLMNSVPPSTTARVEQRLSTAGTRYVEVRFNSTTETRTPTAVDVSGIWRAATAASAAGQGKLRDNLGTTDDAVVNTTIAVTTDTWWTKCYAARPAALGAWTVAALNDIRFRVGFGTDVTPDIWFGGVIAETALEAAPSVLWPGARNLSAMQALNRSGGW